LIESELSVIQISFQELKLAHETTEKEKHEAEHQVASLKRSSAEHLATISGLKLDLARVRGTVHDACFVINTDDQHA
jgi:hypothetical protein